MDVLKRLPGIKDAPSPDDQRLAEAGLFSGSSKRGTCHVCHVCHVHGGQVIEKSARAAGSPVVLAHASEDENVSSAGVVQIFWSHVPCGMSRNALRW